MSRTRRASAWRKGKSGSPSRRSFASRRPSGRRHVVGGGDRVGLGLTEQGGDLGQCRAGLAGSFASVAEGRDPPDDAVPPGGVGGAEGDGRDGERPRVVDDRPPELPPLPPSLVAGVRPHHHQQAKDRAGELVGGRDDVQVGQVLVLVDQGHHERPEPERRHPARDQRPAEPSTPRAWERNENGVHIGRMGDGALGGRFAADHSSDRFAAASGDGDNRRPTIFAVVRRMHPGGPMTGASKLG